MTTLPDELKTMVFTYLHHPYDYEKAQVIKELNRWCDIVRNRFEYVNIAPTLMMLKPCKWRQLQSKYRTYHNKVSTSKCTCVYCRSGRWSIY